VGLCFSIVPKMSVDATVVTSESSDRVHSGRSLRVVAVASVLVKLTFWRSPSDQPRWMRPALLMVAALAATSYSWGINNFPLEPFYAAAARSMGSSWRDFFFGAVDPAGTVTLDKLPGAFWVQALFVRIFGFHYWSVALPQVIAGILTVLVLFRVVRQLSGAKTGLVAALILAASPVTALLNRGNVSDSLLILLTVLAADATIRALRTGRLRSLLCAGLWIGLAFQTKMLQAWLIVPALLLAYVVASPVSRRRRVQHVLAASAVLLLVSLSWMAVVSVIPSHDRPFVDGTRDDSVFAQVFIYNGWTRVGIHLWAHDAVDRSAAFQKVLARENPLVGTYRIKKSADRLLVGRFGRDDAWLLPAALLSGAVLLVTRRRRPREDLLRAGVLLFSAWLVTLGAFFSFGVFINSYYTAALIPAVAALCAVGLSECWRARGTNRWSRIVLLLLVPVTTIYAVALIPQGAGVAWWEVPLLGTVCAAAELSLLVSLRLNVTEKFKYASVFGIAAASMLLASAVTTGVVVAQGLGSFSTPYQSPQATQGTTVLPERFQEGAAAFDATWDRYPPDQILMAVDTSYIAGSLIMVSGREFLPIGGYTGNNPSPTLKQLRHLVANGKLLLFFIPVSPAGNDPRLDWVRRHCFSERTQPYGHGVKFGLYLCAKSGGSLDAPN
jgi:4-amino-4-deoxy-L-arabinose transferase-like glycosyltransferase